MTSESKIQIGVPDFSEPTLLLIADRDGFRDLASQLTLRQQVLIDQSRSGMRTVLRIISVHDESGFYRSGDVYEWRISESEATVVSERLLGLCATRVPAHVYLDPSNNQTGFQIVASVDEYNAEKVFGGMQASASRESKPD